MLVKAGRPFGRKVPTSSFKDRATRSVRPPGRPPCQKAIHPSGQNTLLVDTRTIHETIKRVNPRIDHPRLSRQGAAELVGG